jgi:DNA primase
MVPIEWRMTRDQAHSYCKRLAQRLAATDPDRYTTNAALIKRPGRLFIDYLRNGLLRAYATQVEAYAASDIHGAKVDLFLQQQGVDTTTPGGKALFQMMGVLIKAPVGRPETRFLYRGGW